MGTGLETTGNRGRVSGSPRSQPPGDPGSDGIILLGLIIERAGGASYEEQLQERICGPAGMTLTRRDDNDAIIQGRALG